ncbi:MAG: hypothetical protein OIN84_13430 [Candidatus Methanoperedens sp.]|uniref:hypothetical protein n=1 Tax=Candidatus Methanoperedens sp. BLZ2 TaxID=2035255 RepID=UPI001143F6C8|nr:hypothetical protein [Candidatus Methanoperedens sp. BLZ2]KAB2946602.1 MAG: hypothetical protein F9K14_07015 [Candidatus Methanoperedens sp.]MBZ0173936.1 hypothetical protein [Candidatus Methanoperedens nitroreducens]MCX9078961.1 hypothetical protein [Candidatus Methanoperedens sp.]
MAPQSMKQINIINERSNEYFKSPGSVKQCIKAKREGRTSTHYIDFDNITIDPYQTEDIVYLYSYYINEIVKQNSVDFLVFIDKADGGTVGAIKISGAISMQTKIPTTILRMGKERPSEKLKLPYENSYRNGLKYILITDHVSGGQEVLNAIKAIKENGGIVTDVVTYTSEDTLNVKNIEDIGVHFHTIKMIPLDLNRVGISISKAITA